LAGVFDPNVGCQCKDCPALHQNLYGPLSSCGVTVTGGGRPLDLEEQVLEIAVASTAPEHGADVAVDGFDGSEGNLLVAVVEEAVEMPGEEPTELLEGRQPLPPQGPEPGGEETPRGSLVGVGPQLGELLLE